MHKIFRLCCTAAVCTLSIIATAQNLHKEPTQDEIDYFNNHPEEFVNSYAQKITGASLPSDARFPGEYEESQAVAIGWPYTGSTLDTTSSTARLWASMADAIQQECPVWIRLKTANDTNRLKTFMTNRGTPLQSYRFFFYSSNAFWMRDFGPIGFYYSSNDSVGFVDMRYYNSRPLDDQFPAQLAGELGYRNVVAQFYAEGGNYMTDGWKKSFHSNKIGKVNMNAYGWTASQAADSIRYYWGADSMVVTNGLSCDGGTQHIDMYMKLVDEETFAIMEYPTVVTAPDQARIDSVITMLTQEHSTYKRPYRIVKFPMPTRNDGTYSTTCSQINSDARTFVNGLMVNKTYIMPVFSSATSGNKAGDSVAIALARKTMPGYKIVPLDARILTTMGGAIHCVTMQIPAENPLRIWHPARMDQQHWATGKHLIVKATNRSGIASATAKWRVKGSAAWNTTTLADSAGYKIGDIVGNYTINDTIEYYITATSNNGKTAVKPLTAPAGFYTFYFDPATTNLATLDPDRNFVMNPLPNPNNGSFYIPVAVQQPGTIHAKVTDMMGRTLQEYTFGMQHEGMHKFDFDISRLPSAMYFIEIRLNNRILGTKKVVRQ